MEKLVFFLLKIKHMIVPDLLDKPVVLIDIGAIGNPPTHWLPLKDNIHLVGFEPNEKECRRLNESSNCDYLKSEFLPYAIGEKDDVKPFHITEYNECCSLLKPNFAWLNRFEYGPFFNINQTIHIQTLALDSIERLSSLQPDALKIDAQGNELPILLGAQSIVDHVFLIEIESGLHKNYENETTFNELYVHLNERNFMCMELFSQPAQKRNNCAAKWGSAKGQSMACESIWVRDLLKCEEQFLKSLSKSKFISILSLCWLFGYSDYAIELINHKVLGALLNEDEKFELYKEKAWFTPTDQNESSNSLTLALGYLSHLLPTPARRNLYTNLPRLAEMPNILKMFFKKY